MKTIPVILLFILAGCSTPQSTPETNRPTSSNSRPPYTMPTELPQLPELNQWATTNEFTAHASGFYTKEVPVQRYIHLGHEPTARDRSINPNVHFVK